MIEDERLSAKQALAELSTRLKKVLNPAVIEQEYFGYGIKINTDVPYNTTDTISFSVRCLTSNVENPKTIYCVGYIKGITENTLYCATNLGSARIQKIGMFISEGKLCIVLIPNNDITKTEAEVFLSDTNKNHVSSIEYLEDEYQGELTEITSGESTSGFQYILRNSENNYTVLQNGEYRTEPIDTIYHSIDATSLTHPIEVEVIGIDENENQIITGSAQLSTEDGDSTIVNLDVNLGNIEQAVTDNILNNFPVATDEQIGGIALAGNIVLGANKIPLQLEVINDLPRAYVDLTNANISVEGLTDIHRFVTIPASQSEAGTNLFQYIGPTTEDYTFAYYYQWAPNKFNVSYTSDGWSEIREGGEGVSGDRIAVYNKNNDFILKINSPIVITLIENIVTGDSIGDETQFNISQGDTFSENIIYADIKDKLGFELSSSFITYDSSKNYDLTLSLTTNSSAWKQKNVQPMLKVGSPLIFKGTATWQELQSYSPSAEIGDFYIVTDKANQEYYWTGSEWEFMGQVVEAPEYKGDHNYKASNEYADVSVSNISGSNDKMISTNYNSQEADSSTTVQVGGIAANTTAATLRGKTISEMLDLILFPDAEPTISGSETVSITGGVIKFGETCPTKTGSHTNKSVTYSKLNNTGSVLVNQIYSGTFTENSVLYNGSSTKPDKVTTDITLSYTGSWDSGDKYPCTKKGNQPADSSKRNPAQSTTKTTSATISCWYPYFYGAIDTIPTASTLKENEIFTTSKPSYIEISLSGNNKYHFIALPQGWEVNTIATKAGQDVTGNFSLNNSVSITYTNNGETANSVPMKLSYLYNPTSNNQEYKITLN